MEMQPTIRHGQAPQKREIETTFVQPRLNAISQLYMFDCQAASSISVTKPIWVCLKMGYMGYAHKLAVFIGQTWANYIRLIIIYHYYVVLIVDYKLYKINYYI